MLASQLIYTSWKNGNSPNKGYMVYSKSTDITAEETDEILMVMKYKAPYNLPYTPTDEEIATLFPKNFAYFKLSSGRYCIALSSYVGQDYTSRWGNYLIHAYVVDSMEGENPLSFMHLDNFRVRLTDEELNADAAPPSLPKVELEGIAPAMDPNKICAFFDTQEKKDRLKYYVQAVMNAVNNNTYVNLYDNHDNVLFWLSAAALLLPKSIVNKVYFSTYVVETSNLVTLSCMLPDSNTGAYGQGGFMNNNVSIRYDTQYSNEHISLYVNTVCDKLFSDCFQCVLYVNEMNNKIQQYQINDCDFMIKLISLSKGEFGVIESLEEMYNLLKFLSEKDPEAFESVSEKVFNVLAQNRFGDDDVIISIYKLIYSKLSPVEQENLLVKYIDRALGKFNSGDYKSAYVQIKTDCPCKWNLALKTFIKEDFMDHIRSHKTVYSDMLAFCIWLDVYAMYDREDVKQSIYSRLAVIYADYVSARKNDVISILLASCDEVDKKLRKEIYLDIKENELSAFASNTDYLFEYLSVNIENGADFWSLLCRVLKHYPDIYYTCVEKYVDLLNKNPNHKDNLSRYSEKNETVKGFINATKVCEYQSMTVDSVDDLIDGYKVYVLEQYPDPQLQKTVVKKFFNNLKAVLANSNDKKAIQNGLNLYDRIAKIAAPEEIKNKVLSIVAEEVFAKRSLSVLVKNIEDEKVIIRVIEDAELLGYTFDLTRLNLYYEGYLFKRILNLAKYRRSSLDDIINRMSAQKMVYTNPNLPRDLAEEFSEEYLEVILLTIYAINDWENYTGTFNELLDSYVKPLKASDMHFDKHMLDAIKKDPSVTNKYMALYFEYILSERNRFKDDLKEKIVEPYLVKIGKRNRNDVFESVKMRFKKDNELRLKMDKYIKGFNADHMSFMDKISNLFSTEKENKKNGK